jgi:hypothetical protein
LEIGLRAALAVSQVGSFQNRGEACFVGAAGKRPCEKHPDCQVRHWIGGSDGLAFPKPNALLKFAVPSAERYN